MQLINLLVKVTEIWFFSRRKIEMKRNSHLSRRCQRCHYLFSLFFQCIFLFLYLSRFFFAVSILTGSWRHVVIRGQFVEFQGWSVRYDRDTATPGDSSRTIANRFLITRLFDPDTAATRWKIDNYAHFIPWIIFRLLERKKDSKKNE